MADEKDEEILLTVEVDEGAVEARLVELRKRSSELRAEKDLLRKANRDGSLSNEDYAKSLTKAQLSLNQTTKEIRENERVLDKNTQQQKAAAGSLNQMRAQVSLLYADYASLSKEERNNAEVGGVLQKKLGDLNKELKTEEGLVGDNRRTVGGYAEAIEGAISKNTNFVGTLSAIRSKLGEARDAIKEQVQGYKDTTAGMGTTQKASVALGLGLKAIGIGLLIQAVTALIGFLSKMDAGMDKVEQATAAVEAAFEAFIQTISPIGELIVDTFTHPLDSIVKFGNALLHPIDSLNNIASAGKEMAQNVSANMAKAARAAVDYTKAMQDSEDAQDGLIGLQAKVNKQVSIALLATKDRSKTERERIKLLDDAGKAEQDLSNRVLKIRQDELAALVEFQKSKATLQDADRKKLQEVTAAATNAETENLETQQKIQNRRSALLESEEAERKAAAEKAKTARKDAANERVADAEAQLIEAKQLGKNTLAIEESIIKLRAAAELVDAKGRKARMLIVAQSEAEVLKLRTDYVVKNQFETLQARKLGIDAELVLVQKGTLDELALRQQGLRLSATMEKNDILQTEKNLVLRAAKLKAVDAKLKADLKQNQTAFNAEQLAKQQELDSLRLSTDENLHEQTLANQRKYQAERINLEEQQALESLKLTELTEEQRVVKENAIRAKAIKDRKELDKQVSKDKSDRIKNEIDAQLAGTREGSKEEYKLKKKAVAAQLAADIESANGEESAIAKLKAEAKKTQKKLDKDYNDSVLTDIVNVTTASLTALSTLFTAQSQRALAQLDKEQQAALESAGTNADLRVAIEAKYQKQKEKLEKEAAEKQKKIASIQNIINTAVAVTKAFSEGGIIGPILAALALATGIAQQSVIDSQEFNDGGVYRSDGRGAYIQGPGTGKSDSINSKLSNGESVLTAKATDMFYSQLSAMNVLGGGRPFPGAGGEPVPQLSGFSMGGVQAVTDTDAIATAIITSLKGANFRVAVTDIHAVESDLIYAQAQGNI